MKVERFFWDQRERSHTSDNTPDTMKSINSANEIGQVDRSGRNIQVKKERKKMGKGETTTTCIAVRRDDDFAAILFQLNEAKQIDGSLIPADGLGWAS